MYKTIQKGGDFIQKPQPDSRIETILREVWTHSRHCETQIYWFTTIFAAVVAAILVFMREISSNSSPEPILAPLLAIFGLILSIIGFLVLISLAMGHQNYIVNVIVILHYWEATCFYKDWKKSIHYKDFHRMFFEIIAAFFVVLSLYYGHLIWNPLAVFNENPTLLLFVFILAFFHLEMCYQLVWKKEFDKRKDFIKKLHPTFYQEIEDCCQEIADC